MGVIYNENRNEYKVFIPSNTKNRYKLFSYSVNRYGEEMAKKLAMKSFKDKRRYHDYFEEIDNKIIFFVYTKRYGKEEALRLAKNFRLSIEKENNYIMAQQSSETIENTSNEQLLLEGSE